MNNNKQYDLFEFDIMLKLINSRYNIFPVNPEASISDFYHYLNKGISINYSFENNLDQIPKNVSITKFKKKNKVLESLILDKNNLTVGKVILNGNKELESQFKKGNIEKLSFINDLSSNSNSNIELPKVYFSFECLKSISELIYKNHIDLNPNKKLILNNVYLKQNLNNWNLSHQNKYEALMKTFTDPKGDIWHLFLVKEEKTPISNYILKGFKKYSLN